MTKLIEKYNFIMERYRAGEFGKTHLTMREILERAGEPDLFDKVNIEEVLHLAENSSGGVTKQMFRHIAELKQERERAEERKAKR